MPKNTSRTTTRSKLLLVLLIAVIAVIGAGIYNVRHTTAFVDATTHQPERYTELYFTDPTKLPVNIGHDQTLPVNFTVHNVEARNMSYTYDLSLLTTSGKALSQSQHTFSLTNNNTKVITNDITVPNELGKTEVQIFFPGLNQSIHFWVQIR
jgi:uncharacterized membrane protein